MLVLALSFVIEFPCVGSDMLARGRGGGRFNLGVWVVLGWIGKMLMCLCCIYCDINTTSNNLSLLYMASEAAAEGAGREIVPPIIQ